MKQNLFLRIALPTPLRRYFDYLVPQDIDLKALIPGVRVLVPFGSRKLVGWLVCVTESTNVPKAKLKRALQILDTAPLLPKDVQALCEWAASYYHHALGEVMMHAFPTALRQVRCHPVLRDDIFPVSPEEAILRMAVSKGEGKNISSGQTESWDPENKKRIDSSLRWNDVVVANTTYILNIHQQHAVNEINSIREKFQTFLLDGVTGSGKTEVYMQVIATQLLQHKQVLVLVPEISLTPQTIARFRERFNTSIIALHSNLSAKARLQAWQDARVGIAKIIIGTRSAIFTPFANLGLIIVDEEHDSSFKQQDRFRYHARDLALVRAQILQIPVVLGSATPALESLANAQRARYKHLSLPVRAGIAKPPQYQVINLHQTHLTEGLSTTLLQTMQMHLDANNQVLLYLNRRGFAPVYYCLSCGWMAKCDRCDRKMIYHHQLPRLHCHHCEKTLKIPENCVQCTAKTLQPVGLGTQRLEAALSVYFKDVPIIRVDRDSTRSKDALQNLLKEIAANPKAILLGTQMLAKGHHFSNVTLVGVVDADSGLFSADFRAAEQMGQLLCQVAGRAGREEKNGTVLIQTHHPEHALLKLLLEQGYAAFAQHLLAEREMSGLPPYSYMALLRAESYSEDEAKFFLERLKTACAPFSTVNILGPVPALLAKRKGLHHQHLMLRAPKRHILQQLLQFMLPQAEIFALKKPIKWVVDVDPLTL